MLINITFEFYFRKILLDKYIHAYTLYIYNNICISFNEIINKSQC